MSIRVVKTRLCDWCRCLIVKETNFKQRYNVLLLTFS
uniref:Uncharacterized protein n=1 Tax=Anguilla anguilla TaxID=7936 RepID=A0A0E9WP37_ANGAN